MYIFKISIAGIFILNFTCSNWIWIQTIFNWKIFFKPRLPSTTLILLLNLYEAYIVSSDSNSCMYWSRWLHFLGFTLGLSIAPRCSAGIDPRWRPAALSQCRGGQYRPPWWPTLIVIILSEPGAYFRHIELLHVSQEPAAKKLHLKIKWRP